MPPAVNGQFSAAIDGAYVELAGELSAYSEQINQAQLVIWYEDRRRRPHPVHLAARIGMLLEWRPKLLDLLIPLAPLPFPSMTTFKTNPTRADPIAVPPAVVNRLSLYLRELQYLIGSGNETTSSRQLGRRLGFTDAQVRKDLAHFGQFGHPGIGYRCNELVGAIRSILGTDREWRVALVGVGNLGRALLGYRGFSQQGFRLEAAFDADPAKIGTQLKGVEIHDIAQLSEVLARKQIELGLIAVPASEAQAVADRLVAAGVGGIVNFAPVTLTVPAGVSKVGVDLARELEQVTFSVANRLREKEGGESSGDLPDRG